MMEEYRYPDQCPFCKFWVVKVRRKDGGGFEINEGCVSEEERCASCCFNDTRDKEPSKFHRGDAYDSECPDCGETITRGQPKHICPSKTGTSEGFNVYSLVDSSELCGEKRKHLKPSDGGTGGLERGENPRRGLVMPSPNTAPETPEGTVIPALGRCLECEVRSPDACTECPSGPIAPAPETSQGQYKPGLYIIKSKNYSHLRPWVTRFLPNDEYEKLDILDQMDCHPMSQMKHFLIGPRIEDPKDEEFREVNL